MPTKFRYALGATLWLVTLPIRALRLITPAKNSVDWEGKKRDIIERTEWLCERIIVEPKALLDSMPKMLGKHYGGEWAIYSCAMLSAALVNISRIYPEEREQAIRRISSLIDIVLSPHLREYDTHWFREDALTSLDGDKSHMTYLSLLAWMITNYKQAGGDGKYDHWLHKCCEAMHRRMLQRDDLSLPSFPNGIVFLPDMLVAIVALHNYSKLYDGKYADTVTQWLKKAKKEWLHKKSGLLIAMRTPKRKSGIRGSYSALSCYYLTLIDDTFAKDQYDKMKSALLRQSPICAIREYLHRSPLFRFDHDAGPILFGLSPSGTAFGIGSATYFGDWRLRKRLLTTAELAGCTIRWRGKRHYLLGDFALVGEAAVLAMRTNINTNKQL